MTRLQNLLPLRALSRVPVKMPALRARVSSLCWRLTACLRLRDRAALSAASCVAKAPGATFKSDADRSPFG